MSSVYDLTTAEHDYPEWHGRPKRSIVVLTAPRSGSTLLGEALHATGRLGCALEYLHCGFRPTFVGRWNAPDLPSFVRALHRHRTSPTGTLAIKFFWRDLHEVFNEAQGTAADATRVSPGAANYAAMHQLIAELFPNPTYVFLTRRDRVRAAVSAYVALCTGVYRAFGEHDLGRTRANVPYNYEKILECLAARDYAFAHWRAFIRANDLSPISLDYETLTTDYEASMRAVLSQLGDLSAPIRPRMQRQSAAGSEALLLQFLHDEAAGRRAAGPGH